MEQSKRRKLFRNQWAEKKFYLRSRNPDSTQDFVLMPGAIVEALDEAEEKLLAGVGLVDVEKEAPALANVTDQLQKQLEEEKAKNVALKAEKEVLEAEVEKSKRRVLATTKPSKR